MDELEASIRAFGAPPTSRLESLTAELTEAELAEVVSFAHWVLARRRSAG
jgi:hypothetical protein